LDCGRKDKGNDYSELYDLVKKKVKVIVCMGKDNAKIIEAFKDIVTVIEDTHSMAEAVQRCYKHAKNGDTVLFRRHVPASICTKTTKTRTAIKTCVREL
jgi:UDP-N-acetylmuramoylalanine-D-glutamate ligase